MKDCLLFSYIGQVISPCPSPQVILLKELVLDATPILKNTEGNGKEFILVFYCGMTNYHTLILPYSSLDWNPR
jgi:hypothetical protein